MRRGQQLVDPLLPGVGRWVIDEGFHFGGRRKQAGQVEVRAAKQRAAAGARGGFEALFVESRLEESVDGIRIPARVAGVGNRVADGLAERPPVPVLAGDAWRGLES